MNFTELREFLWESERGQILDSLICVELGLQEYEVAWAAHKDMAEPGEDVDDVIIQFLVNLADFIEVNNEDFDKILASVK